MTDWRRLLGLPLGPALLLIVWALPLDLDPRAHRLAGVFAWVVVYWVTEAVPLAVTALLGPALAVLLGVADARAAFASFGHPIVFLFLGSFLLAAAMRDHGLDRRIALYVLSRRWVGEHPRRILLAMGVVSACLSMGLSNTATAAMMLPIALGVLASLPLGDASSRTTEDRSGFATSLMLMVAYGCNLGGIATPIGTPPNLIALGMIEELRGRTIGFLEWSLLGVPLSLLLLGAVYLTLRGRVPAALTLEGSAGRLAEVRLSLGRWSGGERAAAAAFSIAALLWILPGAFSLVAGRDHPLGAWLHSALPESVVALLAASLLFVLPVDRHWQYFALDWRRATRIDWGTILLFGGGLSMGRLAFDSGLAEAVGRGITTASGGLSTGIVTLLAVFLANVMTEFMSNTAMANLLVPLFLSVPVGSGPPSLLPTLGATLGCSLAFCLPVATPPNAIVYGSGRVKLTTMLGYGIRLNVLCGLLAWLYLVSVARWVEL